MKILAQAGRGFSQVGSQVGNEPGASLSLGPHSVPAKKREPSSPIGKRSSSLLFLADGSVGLAQARAERMMAKRAPVLVGGRREGVVESWELEVGSWGRVFSSMLVMDWPLLQRAAFRASSWA